MTIVKGLGIEERVELEVHNILVEQETIVLPHFPDEEGQP